jgi:hypothetical protein
MELSLYLLSWLCCEIAGFFHSDVVDDCYVCGEETDIVNAVFGVFIHFECYPILELRFEFAQVRSVMVSWWEGM